MFDVGVLHSATAKALIWSLYLVLCRPRPTIIYVNSSTHAATRPCLLLFLIVIRISSTFVSRLSSTIYVICFLFLKSIQFLFIPLQALLSFLSTPLVRRQVSDPFIGTTGFKPYTFIFGKSGKLLLIIKSDSSHFNVPLDFLPRGLHLPKLLFLLCISVSSRISFLITIYCPANWLLKVMEESNS